MNAAIVLSVSLILPATIAGAGENITNLKSAVELLEGSVRGGSLEALSLGAFNGSRVLQGGLRRSAVPAVDTPGGAFAEGRRTDSLFVRKGLRTRTVPAPKNPLSGKRGITRRGRGSFGVWRTRQKTTILRHRFIFAACAIRQNLSRQM